MVAAVDHMLPFWWYVTEDFSYYTLSSTVLTLQGSITQLDCYSRSSISIVQVGDWGRLGEFNQSLVAEAMASRASKLHPDFVLGMGDNFYPSKQL